MFTGAENQIYDIIKTSLYRMGRTVDADAMARAIINLQPDVLTKVLTSISIGELQTVLRQGILAVINNSGKATVKEIQPVISATPSWGNEFTITGKPNTKLRFDVNNPQYHATDVDYESIRPSRTGKMGAGVYMSPSSKYAEKYVGENSRVLPLVTRGQFANEDVAMDIAESIRQKMASQNPDFSVPEWKRQTTQGISDAGYAGQSFSGLESVVTNPENIRSRFAAFDPFRRTAAIAATMGVAAPDLLAAQAEQDAYARNELRKFKRLSAR
jgi:hypothetical protein